MKEIQVQVKQALDVELPDCYANFLTHHGSRLVADPVVQTSWIQGLGNLDFMIGTTQSFRSAFPDLPHEYVVIGYAGKKFIEKLNDEFDAYTMLNTADISVAVIDSLGKWEATSAHFLDWLAQRLIEALLRLDHPSELFVVSFERKDRAEDLKGVLHHLRKEELIDLDDLVLAHRNQHGHLEIHHDHHGSATGAAAGGVTGLLLGTLLLNPLLGAAVGAVTGAASFGLADALQHAGMEDDFINELACLLQPGTWALFALVTDVHRKQVIERVRGLGGKLLTATVSGSDKAALQAVLDGGIGTRKGS